MLALEFVAGQFGLALEVDLWAANEPMDREWSVFLARGTALAVGRLAGQEQKSVAASADRIENLVVFESELFAHFHSVFRR